MSRKCESKVILLYTTYYNDTTNYIYSRATSADINLFCLFYIFLIIQHVTCSSSQSCLLKPKERSHIKKSRVCVLKLLIHIKMKQQEAKKKITYRSNKNISFCAAFNAHRHRHTESLTQKVWWFDLAHSFQKFIT